MTISKTMLIIGARSDVALAVARKFASEGYNLQLAARDCSKLDLAVNDLMIRHNINITTYELNILKNETFTSFINSLDCLPDIALCTVGILGNQKEDENNSSNSALIMRTNYEGPSLLLGEIAKLFEKRGFGSIIGVSSVAGDRGRASNYIYGSAKSGFTAFLSGLRNRLQKSNVTVLTVVPGYVKTKMIKNIETPDILTSSSNHISEIIFRNRFKATVIYPFPWRFIMLIIKLIPERAFARFNL